MSSHKLNDPDVRLLESWLWKKPENRENADRRANPRVEASIPAQIVLQDGPHAITVETVNISASGLYCYVPRYIAPGTAVQAALILPRCQQGEIESRFLDLRGVTVRTDYEEEDCMVICPYRVAICFSDTSRQQREEIASFVQERINTNAGDAQKWLSFFRQILLHRKIKACPPQ